MRCTEATIKRTNNEYKNSKCTNTASQLSAAHSDEKHRSDSTGAAHCERATVSVSSKVSTKTIQSPSTPKSPSECEQNLRKAQKPEKICRHQIQLYHCSICEKVLAASKNVHKQFINSGACENWCGSV